MPTELSGGDDPEMMDAVAAWRALSGDHAVSPISERLFEAANNGKRRNRLKKKSSVFRLRAGDRSSLPIIAKRCGPQAAEVEIEVYNNLLRDSAVSHARFFGHIEVAGPGGRQHWIFLEDVGEIQFHSDVDSHIRAAGRWLALLACESANLQFTAAVPKKDAEWYIEKALQLRWRCATILQNHTSHEDLSRSLEGIASGIAMLQEIQGSFRQALGLLPISLCHGDFGPKNLFLRHQYASLELLPVDWEFAALGPIAGDLGAMRLGERRSIIIQSFLLALREHYRHYTLGDLEGYFWAGRICRLIMSISWVLERSDFTAQPEADARQISYLDTYSMSLREAISALTPL